MLTNPRTKRRPLWMNTSKKVAATEVGQVLAQNRLSNGPDSMTGRDMVEATTGTEAMRTAEATGVEEEEEAVEVTTGLVADALIMDMEGVEVTVVDEEVEDTMTDEIIVAEEEEGVMVVEVMAAGEEEDIVNISRPTASSSHRSNRGSASNKTMVSISTASCHSQAASRIVSHSSTNNNRYSNSNPNTNSMDPRTISTTATTRATKLPQVSNRLPTRSPNNSNSSNNSMAKLHSKPSNKALTRITKVTTLDISSKQDMAVMVVALAISRLEANVL